MKIGGLIIISSILAISSPVLAASKIISCPALSSHHYGNSTYFDKKTGRQWQLSWLNKNQPVWQSVSIPHTNICGAGKSASGLPINYQCVVMQCRSPSVVATLGGDGRMKCYSAYVSTQNNFYCEDFKIS